MADALTEPKGALIRLHHRHFSTRVLDRKMLARFAFQPLSFPPIAPKDSGAFQARMAFA